MAGFAHFLKEIAPGYLGPVMKELGFKKRSGLVWRRDSTLEVRVLNSRYPDFYAGGKFTLEFERSSNGLFHKLSGFTRLGAILDDAQRESFLNQSNSVAISLDPPPQDFLDMIIFRDEYLAKFRPREKFDPEGWMRFTRAEHVHGWFALIVSVIPILVERAELLDPKVINFGDLGY